MRKTNKWQKNRTFYTLVAGGGIFALSLLFGPSMEASRGGEPNMYEVFLAGTSVGFVEESTQAEEYFHLAKEQIAKESDEIVYFDVELTMVPKFEAIGRIDTEEAVVQDMLSILPTTIQETLEKCYMLKINNNILTLHTVEEVQKVLDMAVDQFDIEQEYEVVLVRDTDKNFSVLSAQIVEKDLYDEIVIDRTKAGFAELEDEWFDEDLYLDRLALEDFELGLVDMSFGDEVEIMEAYLKPSEIQGFDYAAEFLMAMQVENQVYKVQSGDTLGGISISTGIPMEELIALNDSLESENSVIRIDQELIVSVPVPALTVEHTSTQYVEEEYDAEVIYVDNDEWYTNQQVTLQNPSAGFRRMVANVSYDNEEEASTEILKEEVLMEAVPKIVERGTQIPPTFIKPLYGGRASSGYGARSLFGRSFHYGEDWATPTGTTVIASSGGVVTKAGWGSGYGYVVYISHPNGVETRYAHNSKVLVSVGDTVAQGDPIALSGNTGDSTGPHVHFEIRINGTAVDPMDYLD